MLFKGENKVSEAVNAIALSFFMATYLYVVYAAYTAAPFYDSWRLFIEDRMFYLSVLRQNEHIINLTAFIFWLDNSLFLGRGILQLTLIGVTFICMGRFFSKSIVERTSSFSVSAVLPIAMFLSATQFTNMTWSFQVGYVWSIALGILSFRMLALVERPRGDAWLIGAISCAALASWGLAAGVLLFPVMGLYIYFLQLDRWKKTLSIAVAISSFILFLRLNVPSEIHDSLNFLRVFLFSLAVLGSLAGAATQFPYLGFSISDSSIYFNISVIAGVLVAAASFSALCLALCKVRSGRARVCEYWELAVALWFGLIAVGIGVGRSQMALDEAISSRYVTISVGFSCMVLVSIAKVYPKILLKNAANFVSSIILAGLCFAQLDRMAQSEVAGRRFEYAEAALINKSFDAPDLSGIYLAPFPTALRSVVDVMNIRAISVFGFDRERMIGMKLFASPLKYNGECRLTWDFIYRDQNYLKFEASLPTTNSNYRIDTAFLTDRSSKVLAVGVVMKWMLGLTPDGRKSGIVFNVPTSIVPSNENYSVFLGNLSNLDFCYSAQM